MSKWLFSLLISLSVVAESTFWKVNPDQSKKFISESFHGRYSEAGFMGHLSDFITIMYVVLYSVAFGYVGWRI